MANGMTSYFMGNNYEHGVWFYFPVLFTIKSTLGMLGLLLLTVVAMVRGWVRGRRALVFLILPPVVYFFVAMDSHLNIGARHILPVWVFCCVIAAAGAVAWMRRGKVWVWVVGLLLVMHVGTTLRAEPNYMAYANEAWGGSTQTYKYLSDSNTDWAQQLVATSDYLKKRGVKQCWIAYFAAPFILPQDYGIPCKMLPTPDTGFEGVQEEVPPVIDGPVLISAGDLNSFESGSRVLNAYEGFRGLKPTAFIQDGVFVFDGQFAVPLASSLSHVQRSQVSLKKGDVAGGIERSGGGREDCSGVRADRDGAGGCGGGGREDGGGAGGVSAGGREDRNDGAGRAGDMAADAGAEDREGAVTSVNCAAEVLPITRRRLREVRVNLLAPSTKSQRYRLPSTGGR